MLPKSTLSVTLKPEGNGQRLEVRHAGRSQKGRAGGVMPGASSPGAEQMCGRQSGTWLRALELRAATVTVTLDVVLAAAQALSLGLPTVKGLCGRWAG